MKKSLFAVAALTAISGAAQAQSSVTVYGIMDVGYVGENTRFMGPQVSAANAAKNQVSPLLPSPVNRAGGEVRQTGNQFGAGAQQTNRIGFRGTEDLGGGTSAFFTVELGLVPQGEQVINTGATQNRQTFVGLKKNGVGSGSIGTQYTVIHSAVGATDPGQLNQMMGDVIYGAASGFDTKMTGVQNLSNSTDNYTVRTNNMLKLQSEKMSGFQVTGFLTANNTNSTQVSNTAASSTPSSQTNNGYFGGINNQNGWGLGANYEWKKLLVTANYQAFTSKNPQSNTYAYATSATTTGISNNAVGSTVAGTFAATSIAVSTALTSVGGPAAWNQSSGGSNVQDNQAYVGATYDFGILKAYGQWSNRKISSQLDSNYYVKRSAQQVGVRSFITPTVEAWASVGNGRYQQYGLSNPTTNFTGYQVGSNYWLSKRTNLYAIYGGVNTSTVTMTNSLGTAGNYSANANNYAVGVRHTF
jgi:predicted porin